MLRNIVVCLWLGVSLAACSGSGEKPPNGREFRGMGGERPDRDQAVTAVPVRIEAASRTSISQHIETNGTLEAEDEVDIVARTTGPITEILVEEGDRVQQGALIARIDDREARNQVAMSTVARDEAQLAFDRAATTLREGLVSQEAYDSAVSNLQTTKVQLENAELQLTYTEIRAPFSSLVAVRYVKKAQYVTPGMPLFRVSAFDPLLCPIEVPEKDLGRIDVGQRAHLEVEAFPGERFGARVARIRPTLDASTGMVTVTLEVDGGRKLRPGMFARVFLEVDAHENVIVIPRDALVLDSIGDTVFVREGDVARRREVQLGFREGRSIEVLAGLDEGDELIVLGQDGLADNTPVTILASQETTPSQPAGPEAGPEMSDERREEIKSRMRERGMPEAAIEEQIRQMQSGERRGPPEGGPPPPGGGGPPGRGGFTGDNLPPMMEQRIRDASPEDLERIKERMQQFGMDKSQVDAIVKKIREESGT